MKVLNDFKQHIILTAVFSCLVIFFTPHKTLSQTQKVDGIFFTQKNVLFHLTNESISIKAGAVDVFSKLIDGKKTFYFSPEKKYLLICNFNFPKTKENYHITFFLFDKDYKLVSEKKLEAFYDMPHQIFAVNDNGVIAAYNPAEMKLNLYEGTIETEISLEEKINYEMERAAFLRFTNKDLFIATTLQPVLLENNEPNTALYKIDLSSKNFNKYMTNLSVVTSLNLSNEKIFISGVKFQNSTAREKTLVMNLELSSIGEMNFQVHSVCDETNCIGSDGKIYRMEKEVSIIQDFSSLGKIFSHAIAKDNSPFLLVQKNGKYAVAGLINRAENHFEINLLSMYFETDFINGFIFDDNTCYLFTNTQTIFIH